jgi:D-3-phosphoglycerate dehydrogenase
VITAASSDQKPSKYLADSYGRVMRALLLENIHPQAQAAFEQAHYEVASQTTALDQEQLIAALAGISVLGIRSTTPITKYVLDQAPELAAIGAFCIGTNHIALDCAAERGIAVFNAPFSNTRSVVELVVSEMIALSRHLTDKNRLHPV